MIINIARHKRPWQPTFKKSRSATIMTLPVLPRLLPIPQRIAPSLDDQEMVDLLLKQADLVPHPGMKIELTFEALVREVGEAQASKIVWSIVNEYIDESRAA